jgi:flagellar hook-associated protein 2
MSTSGTTSASGVPASTFTGSSAYATSLANVITRAVTIASLPIEQLQNQQTALANQQTEMQSLDGKFSKLQADITGISEAMSGSSFQSTVSAPTVVSATTADGAAEGVYSIKVNSIGSYATSLSGATWNATKGAGNPVTYTLEIGNQGYNFTTTDNSAANVAAAINAQFGGSVQATVVNVGSSGVPDERIALQSTTLGPTPLDLRQSPSTINTANLQTQDSTGYAISQTTGTWDASNTTPQQYTLTIGSDTFNFTPTGDNSAANVAAAINSNFAGQVQATVVNVGTNSAPDNRIALESLTPGAQTLDLSTATSASLQTQQPAATSLSSATWNAAADPSGHPNVYTLTLGTNTLSFSAADNSAATVAAAINSNFGSQVNASVVNLGTPGTPDYRISLQDLTGAGQTMQLQQTGVSLQKQQTAGTLASYEIDNSGTTVTSASRDVTVSTGVTLSLLATSSTPVDVTITRSTSALDSALSAFVNDYNATATELESQTGQSGGALQGNSIIRSLQQALSSISTFSSSSGNIAGLTNLGMTLGTDGQITYDSLALDGTDIANSAGVTAFLGSATGGGFLKAAANALTSIEDPTTGIIKTSEAQQQTQLSTLATNISTRQAQVALLQTNLTNQMSAADAMLSSLSQQSSYLTSMFSAQQTADYTYAEG